MTDKCAMQARHESTLGRHENDIEALKAETKALKAGLSSIGKEQIGIRKDVMAVIADLQKSLTKATEKLADVAVALSKSDETIRALAHR